MVYFKVMEHRYVQDIVHELWRTDGTAAGTFMLMDHVSALADAAIGVTFCFVAGTSQAGAELWMTDGSPAGTKLAKDIRPGPKSSSPNLLTVAGNTLLFFADDGKTGRELWSVYLNWGPMVQLLLDINRGPASSFSGDKIVSMGGKLYFFADDGRPAGVLSEFSIALAQLDLRRLPIGPDNRAPCATSSPSSCFWPPSPDGSTVTKPRSSTTSWRRTGS